MEFEELPEDFDELKSWVENREAAQLEARQQMPELAQLVQKQLDAERELKVKLNELIRMRQEYQAQQDRIRKQSQEDSNLIAQAKRRLETFASEKATRARYLSEFEEFDKITETYQWREFAFEHQIDGAKRLASARRAILGDKRGLGKSLTSLIYADMLGAKRILVFAPKDVLYNFKREIEHWTPHRHVAVVGGLGKVQRDMFLKLLASQEQYLLLMNYEAWRRDPELLELLKSLKADTVIIDEAHNIKEKRTSAYQGIRDIIYAENCCNICHGDIERAYNGIGTLVSRCVSCLHEQEMFGEFCSVKNVLPMTGTAILNRPDDLWTLLHLVDRELFPSQNKFLQDYCHNDLYTGRWKFRPGGEKALISKLGFKFIKRSKEDTGLKSMPQTWVKHELEFDPAMYPDQHRIMEQIKQFDSIIMDRENEVKLDIIGILPQLLRRRQAITWPAGIKIWERDAEGRKTGRVAYEAPAAESIKMDKAMEIADMVINEEEDRLVIFSQFKEALKEFERRFKKMNISVVRYDGDIRDDVAQAAQLDFDGKTAANHPRGTDCNSDCKYYGQSCNGYRWQVILAHYKKGGVGLNLNGARQCIFLDREWNPGKEDQAAGRIDRLDNLTDSIIHTIHVGGSIDAFMDELNEQKKQMIDGLDTAYEETLEKLKSALQDGNML